MRYDRDGRPLLDRAARFFVLIGGLALIITAFVITTETLIRKFADTSLGSVFELTAYVFAISSSWAFGWALLQGTHIRIEILRDSVGPHARAALDLLALVCFTAVFGVITYRAIDLTIDSYQMGARSLTPARTLLFIPQSLWALGFVVTFTCAAWLLVRVVVARSTRVLVPKSEVERELEHLR